MAPKKKILQEVENAFLKLQLLKKNKKPTNSRDKVRVDQIERLLKSAQAGTSKTRKPEDELRLALELISIAQVGGREEGSSQPENAQDPSAQENEEQSQESPLKQTAKELGNRALEEGKDRAIQMAKDKAKQAAANAVKRVGLAIVRFFATRAGIVVLAILAVLGLIVMVVLITSAGGQNKISGLSGSSFAVAMDYEKQEHKDLVDRVIALTQGAEGATPILEVTAPAKIEDLTTWSDQEGKKVHVMDYRIMKTITYIADQGWEKIIIGQLKSEAPDLTTRKNQHQNLANRDMEAFSTYATGQGMGIVALGLTSPGLTTCLGLQQPIPVQIAWQETMLENKLRPIYEQLQIDAGQLYVQAGNIQLNAEIKDPFKGLKVDTEKTPVVNPASKALSVQGRTAIDNLMINLNRFKEITAADVNPASIRYADQALGMLSQVNKEDPIATEKQLEIGLRAVFRLMQVANVSGWQGDESDGCRLWKAYEARNNIRKLALQMLQMPVKMVKEGQDFNDEFVAKQFIVYSPEDDLDNGLPDRDVFPFGATAVGDGGVAFDDSGKDGKVDDRDNHFMAMPFDNGAFSKTSTVFVYREDSTNTEKAPDELKIKDRGDDLNKLHEELDSNKSSAGRVSYKNFIQIAF